jgi:hypothetical protein
MNNRKLIIAAVLFVLGLALTGWQWTVLQHHKDTASEQNREAVSLSAVKEQEINAYQEVKVDALALRSGTEQDLNLVFPTDEGITDLTRMLDEFAVRNNFQSNPFFIGNISYQSPKDAENDTQVLPMSLSVTTSRKNLDKFLDFVEQSGSLKSETRLMSIESMDVTMPSEFGGTYSVRFQIHAYFSREI